MIRTSMPISRKRTLLRISSTISQNGKRWLRVRSDITRFAPMLPISKPATTTAIGADM
ncbi:hypothetical protein D3C71_1929050 [compost metagenome]